jgi:hypothetical protein
VAVDQQRPARLELPDRLGRQQPAVADRLRLRAAAVADRLRGLRERLVADQLACQLQRRRVRLAGQDELGAVAVEHGGGAAAVAVGELGLVVPDRQQQDALPPSRGGELRQLLDRGAVAGLVQADEQPRIEHPVRLLGGQLLGAGDNDADQQLEQRAQALLLGGGRV